MCCVTSDKGGELSPAQQRTVTHQWNSSLRAYRSPIRTRRSSLCSMACHCPVPTTKSLSTPPSRGVQLLNNHGHPHAGYPHCTTNKITCMDRLITRMQVICLHHTYPAEHTVIGESIPLAAAGMAFQACVQHMPLMACNTVSLSSRLVIPNQRNCDTQTLLHYYHSRRSQTEACRTSSHHHTDAEIPRRSTYMVIQPSNSPSSNGRTHTVVEWS